jgi:CheY-like chemotaxis protein
MTDTPEPPRPRILVVDDNEDAAELLAEVLEARGLATRVAHDGPAALDVARSFDPELALLDIGLPEMDGYELARRLRAQPGGDRLRLIALTGYQATSDPEVTRGARFDAHLVKPVDIAKLESLVRELAPGPG